MAHIDVRAEVSFSEPSMVEGLPGVGLVGKIAVDHLVQTLDMTHYANVHCEGVPPVVVYRDGQQELTPPVRLYADAERDLLALQSDVPLSPAAATEFADCFASWYDDENVTPIFLSGLPSEKGDAPPALTGVGTGAGVDRLAAVGIDGPAETGLVSGPTGALLAHAVEHGRDAVGLIVESDPQFPDPEAARVLLTDGIEPLTGVEVDTQGLVDQADEIRQAKENLAKRMQEVEEESSQARPLRMYQ
jgi:uncharacterized protein